MRLSHMRWPLRLLAPLTLIAALSGCGGSGSGAVAGAAPPPTNVAPGGPAAGETVAGQTYDITLDSLVDGEAIAFTVHEPEMLTGGVGYPLILHSHGYGGSRQATRPADDSFIGQFLVNGYGVLSLDERGHNDSGGTIRILDPALEGQDWLQALDWTEANLEWLAYDSNGFDTGSNRGNPIMGAIGGSYGGGYQHLIHAIDEKHRLDAIAPDITWFDLRYSLFSSQVFKSGWGSLLSVGGNQPGNNQDTQLNQALVMALATNTISDTDLDLLYAHSLRSHCEGNNDFTTQGGLRAIDAFYSQSHLDTLFNGNELIANANCMRALGGDVRMMVKAQGHGLENGDGGERCGTLERQDATLSWYNQKLLGQTDAAAAIPEYCFNLGREGSDGVILTSVPVGGTATPQVVIENAVIQEAPPNTMTADLYTAPAGGAVLAGIPTINLSVTAPVAEGVVDPIIFVGLGLRPAGGAAPSDSFNNQVRPFRGYGDFTEDLIAVSQRLEEGDTVVAMIFTGDPAQYAGSGTPVATTVNITADIELPIPASVTAAP